MSTGSFLRPISLATANPSSFGMSISSSAICGRALARRTRYWFVFVIACIECLFMPFGTILGVFTLIVLSRESIKNLFLSEPSSIMKADL